MKVTFIGGPLDGRVAYLEGKPHTVFVDVDEEGRTYSYLLYPCGQGVIAVSQDKRVVNYGSRVHLSDHAWPETEEYALQRMLERAVADGVLPDSITTQREVGPLGISLRLSAMKVEDVA